MKRGSGISQVNGTAPHPDHFDPTKYDADGRRIGGPRGRPAKVTREQVEQLLFLDLIERTAARDVVDYLVELGYETPARQSEILKRARNGWRPTR